mgnify:CR=1 FL=1
MKLSQFDFKLASTRTAIHPSENRDESRLMVVHKKTGKIESFVITRVHVSSITVSKYMLNG